MYTLFDIEYISSDLLTEEQVSQYNLDIPASVNANIFAFPYFINLFFCYNKENEIITILSPSSTAYK